MERGEAHGRCVISYSALKIAKPDWLRERKINLLVTTASARLPEFPDVPAVVDLAATQEDRALVEVFAGPTAMARSFTAPPGVAPNTTVLLRRAFDTTVDDPEFRAEAAKMQAELSPSTGEDVQQLVGRIYATPWVVIERAKRLFAP
jgi:tripartite-type tricarboxylate transporter receptor subunit TctC